MLGAGSRHAVRLPVHAHTLLPCSAKVVHADSDGRWQCNECHRFAPSAPEPMFHCPNGPCDYDVCNDCVTRLLSQRPQSMLLQPYLPMHRHPAPSPLPYERGLPRQQYMATPLRPPTSMMVPAFMPTAQLAPHMATQSTREEEAEEEPALLALLPPASSETEEPPVEQQPPEASAAVKGDEAEDQVTALVPPSPTGTKKPSAVQASQPPRVSKTPLPAMMQPQPQVSGQRELVRPQPQQFTPYPSDAALRHAPYYYDARLHGQPTQGGMEGVTLADYQNFARMYPPYTLQHNHNHPALLPQSQALPAHNTRAAPLTVPVHQHALVVADPNKVYGSIEGGWKCNSCHRLSPQAPEPMFHCPQSQCDFDICSDCYEHYQTRSMAATHPHAGSGYKSRHQNYAPGELSQKGSALCTGRSLFSLFGLFGGKNEAHHHSSACQHDHNHGHGHNHGHSHSHSHEVAHKSHEGKANNEAKDAFSSLPPCRVSTHRHELVARAPPSNWSLLNGVVVEWSFECDACGRADADAPQPFYACPKWYCSYSLCSECTAYYAEDGAGALIQGALLARKGCESHETRPSGMQRDQGLEQGTLDYRHTEASSQYATADKGMGAGESLSDGLVLFTYEHSMQHQNHPANIAYSQHGHAGKAYEDYHHSLAFSHAHPSAIDGVARNGGFSGTPSPYMMGGRQLMHPAYQRATE
jgi:hypothetical protein